MVVKRFGVRGALSLTRLGRLVVRLEGSCLGWVAEVGINDCGCGSDDCVKGVYIIKKGGR